MPVNALDLIQSFAVALPVFAMSLVAFAAVVSCLKQLIRKPKRPRTRRRFAIAVVSVAMRLTFSPLCRDLPS
jgi:hypothetical protein